MFLKLIKHEMRASGRLMLPLMAILPVLAVISGAGISSAERYGSVIAMIISVLSTIGFVLGVFAIMVMAFVVVIRRFRRSMLTDEGYLTNTLPVSVHSLIWSRLVTALIYYILALLTIVLSVLLLGLVGSLVAGESDIVTSEFSDAFYFYGIDPDKIDLSRMIGQIVWAAAVGLIGSCLVIYAALSLGHAHADHKILMSIVYYIAISIVTSAVNSAASVNRLQKLSDVVANADAETVLMQLYTSQVMTATIISLVIGATCYVITVLMLKKKLNLA